MSDAAESKATKAKAKSKAGKAGKAPKAKDKTPIWSKGRMKQIMQQVGVGSGRVQFGLGLSCAGRGRGQSVPACGAHHGEGDAAVHRGVDARMHFSGQGARRQDQEDCEQQSGVGLLMSACCLLWQLPGHLKLAVQGNQRFDFLKTLVAAADDLPAKKPAKSEDGKASRKRKAKASSSSEDDDDDDDDAEDSPSPSPKPKPKPKPAKRAKTEHEKADPSSAPAVKLEGKHECKLGSSFSDGGGSSSSGGGGGGGGRSGSGVPPIKQEAAEGSAVFGRPSAVFVERNLDD